MLRFFTCTLISLFLYSTVNAADIAILPVGLSLKSSNAKGMITISNRGKEKVVLQAETVSWTQADGKDIYAPTQDLLVNPPLFTIQPGRSQVLRVGLRKPQTDKQEVAYRINLREVPAAAPAISSQEAGGAKQQGNILVLLQVRLPVYITPASTVELHQWQAQRKANGTIEINVNNGGNIHTLINELNLRAVDAGTDTPPLATVKAGNVIFPGQSHSWELKPQTNLQGQRYKLEIKTDRGLKNVPLDLGPI